MPAHAKEGLNLLQKGAQALADGLSFFKKNKNKNLHMSIAVAADWSCSEEMVLPRNCVPLLIRDGRPYRFSAGASHPLIVLRG